MANPIKIVADVGFDANQIQQAGNATVRPALSRLASGLKNSTTPLSLLVTADPSNAQQVISQFASSVNTSMDTADSSVQRFTKGVAEIGAAGIGIGAILTSLGSGEQQAAEQLDQSITNAGQSVTDYKDRIDQAEASGEKFAQTHENTDNALRVLVQSYGDTGAALDRMQVTENLAAARGESLTQAATEIARVHGGATRVLKQFDIQVGQNKDGSKDYEGAIDELSRKLDGQAAASVDNATGKFRVFGTELKDEVATFGQQYGPAILIASTGITALSGITSAYLAVQAKRTAASAADLALTEDQVVADEELAAATEETIIAASALTFTEEELTAGLAAANDAMALNAASAYGAIPGLEGMATANEALAASEADVAAGAGAAGAGGALSFLGTGAVATGVALAIPLAGAAALTYGLKSLSDHLGLTDTGFTTAVSGINEGGRALDGFKGDLANFSTDSLSAELQKAAGDGTLLSKALKDGHVTTIEWSNALTGGATELQAFMTWLSKTPGVTRDEMDALAGYTQGLQDNSEELVKAAVKTGDLKQAQVDAAVKDNTINGYTSWTSVVAELAANGSLAKTSVDDLNTAGRQVSAEQVKALNDELQQTRANADAAFQSVLQLAPADIRVQRGQTAIDEDKARIDAAQAKLKWDTAAGASAQVLAQDQRDLKTAQLDLEQATLDEAAAMEELNKQQIIAAGGHVSLQEQTAGTIGFLDQLNGQLTGSTHAAIQDYIDQMAAAALMTAALDQEQQRQVDNEQRRLAGLPAGFIGPPPAPKATTPPPTSAGPRAAGGWVPGNATFPGAEQGWELAMLPTAATYQAPSTGTYVIPHSASVDLMNGLAGGSNQPQRVYNINAYADQLIRRPSDIPDAIAVHDHLVGL